MTLKSMNIMVVKMYTIRKRSLLILFQSGVEFSTLIGQVIIPIVMQELNNLDRNLYDGWCNC